MSRHTPRPSASVTTTVKAAVLRDLRAAYPRGRSTIDLLNEHGTCAKTRIGDLTEDGWDIRAEEVDGAPGYRLASMTRGTADPVEWGLRARLGASTGLVVTTYGTSTIVLPEAVEARILSRVEQVIREELAKERINTGTDTIVEEEEEDPFGIFGLGTAGDAEPDPRDGWEPDDIDYDDDIDDDER
jgi:hypothetical protein